MFGIGERAFELVKDVERQMGGFSGSIPTYDENGVRQVLDEMQILYDQNQRAVFEYANSTMGAEILAGLSLRHAGLERDKDCLLAYLTARLERIRELRWVKGSVLPEQDQNNMTEQETQYFQDYNKILANYMRSIGDEDEGLDLMEHMDPPKSYMVYFKVVKDYGEYEPEDGKIIVLQKNGVHFLPRYQCETLIRQGVIEILHE